MRRRAFTLIELIIAAGLFVFAIGLSVTSVIGANSVIKMADYRSALVANANTINDLIRRYAGSATKDKFFPICNGYDIQTGNTCTDPTNLIGFYTTTTSGLDTICVSIAKSPIYNPQGNGNLTPTELDSGDLYLVGYPTLNGSCAIPEDGTTAPEYKGTMIKKKIHLKSFLMSKISDYYYRYSYELELETSKSQNKKMPSMKINGAFSLSQ